MGLPYTITAINDIPLSDNVTNILQGLRGRTLSERSLVEIALNAEDVDVTVAITVGATEVMPANSRITLQATVGVLPIFPDDIIASTFGKKGDEIIIAGVNADAAAAAELRAVVRVTPISDVALRNAVKMAAGTLGA